MPYEITTRSNVTYEDIVEWCQEKVGDLQWSRHVVLAKGKGWQINSVGYSHYPERFILRIDDAKIATLAALKWS